MYDVIIKRILCLCVALSSLTEGNDNALQPAENLPGYSAIISVSSKSKMDNYSVARLLCDDYLTYWNETNAAPLRHFSEVNVFCFDNIETYDKLAIFVHPEYKVCSALIYGISGNKFTRLGEIFCGYGFALSSGENNVLRTTRMSVGSHSRETTNTYYSISEGSIEQKLKISVMDSGYLISGYYLYNDELDPHKATSITSQEYDALKADADSVFSDAEFVSIDTDCDFDFDSSFDLSGDGDLTDYIYHRISD